MPRVGHRLRKPYLKGAAILAAVLILTASHFLVGGGTHGLHEVHIVLGGMYIVPIIAAALW
ncbi:MAG TPA: hypothetical protein VE866_00265, partial [Candidatus Binatia bacterium]|nr:hypothetical protein [Candidatus Binatia bacterium]